MNRKLIVLGFVCLSHSVFATELPTNTGPYEEWLNGSRQQVQARERQSSLDCAAWIYSRLLTGSAFVGDGIEDPDGADPTLRSILETLESPVSLQKKLETIVETLTDPSTKEGSKKRIADHEKISDLLPDSKSDSVLFEIRGKLAKALYTYGSDTTRPKVLAKASDTWFNNVKNYPINTSADFFLYHMHSLDDRVRRSYLMGPLQSHKTSLNCFLRSPDLNDKNKGKLEIWLGFLKALERDPEYLALRIRPPTFFVGYHVVG